MLSRLVFRNAEVLSVAARGIQTSAPALNDIPRQKRPIYPAPVRHGFVPERWFELMYPKTGVTGPYMLLISYSTYLISKEIYVMEHEFYNTISLLALLIYGVKQFGPKLAASLDKDIEDHRKELYAGRDAKVQAAQDEIDELEREKYGFEAQALVYDARKINVAMTLEAVFRERMMSVYTEVKNRLDYSCQINIVERRIAQKHMVQWIIANVLKSITPEQEKANLQQCIRDLETLAANA